MKPLTKRQPMFTPAQIEAVKAVARGEHRKATASNLGISVKALEDRLLAVKKKLGFNDCVRLTHFAILVGWVQLGECNLGKHGKPAWAK